MCSDRYNEQLERWRKLGAKIGLDEWDIKGGDDVQAEAKMPSYPETNEKIDVANGNHANVESIEAA